MRPVGTTGGRSVGFGRPVVAPAREPDSLPRPDQAAGTVDDAMPFDHIVVVMMENHSFDNVLGGLARSGQPAADGLTFDSAGAGDQLQPGRRRHPATVTAFAFPTTAQGPDVSQTWNATHEQIDGGKMDGFVRSVNSTQPMGYFPRRGSAVRLLRSRARSRSPTAGSARRPAMTIPNRRFLMAGTAYGAIATDVEEPGRSTATQRHDLRPPPRPRDQLARLLHRRARTTAVIPSIVEKYPGNLATLDDFFDDCAAGTLPSVSFVDPEVGAVSVRRQDARLAAAPRPDRRQAGHGRRRRGGAAGHVLRRGLGAQVVEAVLHSPAWPRTLLIYTYDEHGGYYDHVPPPRPSRPTRSRRSSTAGDVPGGYDIYGPRVPAVVASPYAAATRSPT